MHRPTSPSGWLINLAAIVVILAGLRAASSVVVLLLVAAFLSAVTAPLVFWLERRRMPRTLAALCALSLSVAVVLVAGLATVASVNAFVSALPFYRARLNQLVWQLRDRLADRGISLAELNWFESLDSGQVLKFLADAFTAISGVVGNSILVLLIVAFTLLEVSTFEGKLAAAFGGASRSVTQFREIAINVGRYLVWKSLISLATGVGIWVWLTALDVDFALLWGLLAFLLNYIPNFGSILAAVPAIVLALVQLGPAKAVLVAIGYLVVNLIMGNIVEPRLIGRALGLSPLVVLLSLLLWGWVFGPVGLFLAAPLTMAVKIVLESHPDARWLAVLLGPGTAPGDGSRPPDADNQWRGQRGPEGETHSSRSEGS